MLQLKRGRTGRKSVGKLKERLGANRGCVVIIGYNGWRVGFYNIINLFSSYATETLRRTEKVIKEIFVGRREMCWECWR